MTDEITQAEKKQIIKDTYLARAVADTDLEAQGRFKKQNPTSVTAAPTYPRQPSNSPWAKGIDEVSGKEGPFDIDIEYVGALGGESSSAPVIGTSTVETANATEGGASPTALTGAPHFLRRRV
jgi:hypothetical protein